jgi:hypothetical protein
MDVRYIYNVEASLVRCMHYIVLLTKITKGEYFKQEASGAIQ